MEILESKDRSYEHSWKKNLNNLALLELREKEFYLRFRAIPENSDKDIGKKFTKAFAICLDLNEKAIEKSW